MILLLIFAFLSGLVSVLTPCVFDNSLSGADVHDGVLTIDTDRLYNLIDLRGKTGRHLLKLEFENKGIEAFVFTFG